MGIIILVENTEDIVQKYQFIYLYGFLDECNMDFEPWCLS